MAWTLTYQQEAVGLIDGSGWMDPGSPIWALPSMKEEKEEGRNGGGGKEGGEGRGGWWGRGEGLDVLRRIDNGLLAAPNRYYSLSLFLSRLSKSV